MIADKHVFDSSNLMPGFLNQELQTGNIQKHLETPGALTR